MEQSLLDNLTNVASANIGTRVVAVSDEFFAAAERMLSVAEPIFRADVFDAHGKWMDGWETRRRRCGNQDYDWALIRLGAPGEVVYVDIDTRFFTGNFPPFAEIQVCMSEGVPDDSALWQDLLPKTELAGDSHNYFSAIETGTINWVRLKIYPDGGVARLRLYGHVRPQWDKILPGEIVELSALYNGGRIITYSDAHYGNVHALLSERRADNMGDGWETRRRRVVGNDWIIIALGCPGVVHAAVVDTAFFIGNFPQACMIQGALKSSELSAAELSADADSWAEILPRQKLEANHLGRFGKSDIVGDTPINYVRLNIYPDGGVSRLRIFGEPRLP